MDQQASFETRAVLVPRRARLSRLALLLPVIALVATAWAGVSGARQDVAIVEAPAPAAAHGSEGTASAGSSLPARASAPPQPPGQALGFDVHRLVDVEQQGVSRGQVIAVSGWYVATAITDCPPMDAIYRSADVPAVGDDWDSWAFCERSGVLFATQPDDVVVARQLAVPVTVVLGVVMPPELEMIGRDATQVVVLGHFVKPTEGCGGSSRCRDTLVVDYVAWTPNADG